MPSRWRIPDTEQPLTLHISLPHDQSAPGESLATVIIHAMDFTLKKFAAWVILSLISALIEYTSRGLRHVSAASALKTYLVLLIIVHKKKC